MKCRKCRQKAVINMRQHKLALCAIHFPQWMVEQTQRFIEKYRMFTSKDRVLVAVSGGKDSLSLWDILWQLGYNVDGVYIALGIDDGFGYSQKSQALCEKFADQRGLKLIVIDAPQQIGLTIPELAKVTQRGKNKPCSVCGLTKRHLLDRVALEGKYDVLATGHNLDDEAAVLFGNTLNWNIGYLHRQSPVLPARHAGLVRKVKPLCRFYEREMAAYALVRGIEYIYEECPHAEGSTTIYYKSLLNQLEADRPGAKLSFYLSFLQAKQRGLFAQPQEGEEGFGAGGERLYTCPSCGGPTTVEGLCAFCRMVEKVK
ncbi:MAG: ATP-binding protein [Anaerolineales bacterium]